MDTINKELKDRAISLGLCEMWQKNWSNDKSPQELIDMYKMGIDFCIENNYPSNEYIKNNFDSEIREKNNIYVNEEFYKYNPENDCIVLDGKGKFTLSGYLVRDIYINGNSDVEIEANDFTKIFVNVYENAKVFILQKGNSSVYVYRHGDNSVLFTGNVIVRGVNNH